MKTISLNPATPENAAELAALHNAVSEYLTTRHGKGHWTSKTTEKGVLYQMRTSRVYIAKRAGRVIATLNLATKKPWAIDRSYFTECETPLYLTNMAVVPRLQRQGIGRRCILKAIRIAKTWPADAIRLDAYDAAVGAGGFYAACGFEEVGRVNYKGTPLIYFEMLIRGNKT